jgi:putative Ca2+/H+ antiporter (TMEM165/GDT1 family)
MDWRVFWVTFGTIFLAEMGDKTQLAALSMTAETKVPLAVLAGACTALCLATFLGVMVGNYVSHWLPEAVIRKVAGLAFLVIGGLILMGKW